MALVGTYAPAPTASAQTGPCTVSVAQAKPGVLAITVNPPPEVRFIQSPGFEFVVTDPSGKVVSEGGRDDGQTGPALLDASVFTPGTKYTVTAVLVSKCSTTLVRGGSLPQLEQPTLGGSLPDVLTQPGLPDRVTQPELPDLALANVEPRVEILDCPLGVMLGDELVLRATATDLDGSIVATWWLLGTGEAVAGKNLRVTVDSFAILGATSEGIRFLARDDDGAVSVATCSPSVIQAFQVETDVPEPTATPQPEPTATPVPEPTATPQPEPTATAEPEPTAVTEPVVEPSPEENLVLEPAPTLEPEPEPEPTPEPEPDPTEAPEPTEGPEPTAPAEPTAAPEPTLPPEPSGEPERGDQDAGQASTDDHPSVIPAVLEAEWPEPMIVDEIHPFVVRLVGKDWRPDAGEFDDDGQIITIDEETGTKTHEIAVYGVEGPVTLRLDVNPDELEIVSETEGKPASDHRRLLLQKGTRPAAVWDLRPLKAGSATVKIITESVVTAVPSDFLDDDELQLLKIAEVAEPIELQVEARNRTTWHDFKLWHALPLLLLPWLPVGELVRTSSRRNPNGDPEGAGGSAGAAPQRHWESGDVGLVLSGGGLRATAFAAGAAMYLADADRWKQLRQIASVSGGSLTNAFVTHRTAQLGRLPAADDFADLSQAIAVRGLSIETGIRYLAAAMGLGTAWIAGVLLWAAPSAFAAIPWIIIAAVVWCLLCWLMFVWLGLRPGISRWIPRFMGISRDLKLSELGIGAPHRIASVFTSTTLRSRHAHLSQAQSIIASDNLDRDIANNNEELDEPVVYRGEPAGIRVADAVQASAAFPGLPQVVMNSSAAGFGGVGDLGDKLVLRDGGTLDNLGHLSQTLFAAQSDELQGFLTGEGAIQTWIVVDSSAHRAVSRRRPEFVNRILRALHLGAAADLAEMAGSAPANRAADSAARMKTHFADTGSGVYLALRDSPYDYARSVFVGTSRSAQSTAAAPSDEAVKAADANLKAFIRDRAWPADLIVDDPRRQAAQRVLEHLVHASLGENADQDWATQSQRNKVVATTLSSLGPKCTNDLLRHGYALAAATCHIDLGWDLPPVDHFTERRFDALINHTDANGTPGTGMIDLADAESVRHGV